ncbi:MAG TPA: hypothetical protein VHU91_05425 [Mycobacteriales bacterium]|nr:hypothetical protein [Mycobacteriales bacterium]
MHINAFVPTAGVVLENETVNAVGVPQVEIHLPPLQDNQAHQSTAPILLCVSAENGAEHDPQLFVIVHDAGGQMRARLEQIWVWDDVPDRPLKWRVFNLMLPFLIFGEGIYTFGVYAGPEDQPDQALASFQIPIILDAPGQLPQGQWPPQ